MCVVLTITEGEVKLIKYINEYAEAGGGTGSCRKWEACGNTIGSGGF